MILKLYFLSTNDIMHAELESFTCYTQKVAKNGQKVVQKYLNTFGFHQNFWISTHPPNYSVRTKITAPPLIMVHFCLGPFWLYHHVGPFEYPLGISWIYL